MASDRVVLLAEFLSSALLGDPGLDEKSWVAAVGVVSSVFSSSSSTLITTSFLQ